MTRIIIRKIIWDEWNRKHIQKHTVSEQEVEGAGKSLLYHRRTYKNRYLAVGSSEDRLITLIIHRMKQTEYYIITARDANRKERRRIHEKESKKQNP